MPEFLWKWRREIVFTILIIISLGILVSQHSPGLMSLTLQRSMSFVLVPFQKATFFLIQRSRSYLTQSMSLKKLRKENGELRQQLANQNLMNTLLLAQARENQVLRETLQYRQQVPWNFLPAEIIGRDPVSWLQRAVVDRGSGDKVIAGAGVISPQGVVGRVTEIDNHSAAVMFILDSQSSVAGVVDRSRVSGTVKGAGGDVLKLMYVANEDDVRVGDVVVTSKLSSLFPPGIPIGDVSRVVPSDNGLMLDIDLKPRVNFKVLDRFLILVKEE